MWRVLGRTFLCWLFGDSCCLQKQNLPSDRFAPASASCRRRSAQKGSAPCWRRGSSAGRCRRKCRPQRRRAPDNCPTVVGCEACCAKARVGWPHSTASLSAPSRGSRPVRRICSSATSPRQPRRASSGSPSPAASPWFPASRAGPPCTGSWRSEPPRPSRTWSSRPCSRGRGPCPRISRSSASCIRSPPARPCPRGIRPPLWPSPWVSGWCRRHWVSFLSPSPQEWPIPGSIRGPIGPRTCCSAPLSASGRPC